MELKKILIIVLAALLVVLIACLIVKCVVPASDPETTLPQTTDEAGTGDGQGNAGGADNEDWELPIDIDDSFAQGQTTEPESTSDTTATGADGEIMTTETVDEPATTVTGNTTGGNTDEPQEPETSKPTQSDTNPTVPPAGGNEDSPAETTAQTTTKNPSGQPIELPKIPG